MLTLQRPTVSAGPSTCAAYWLRGAARGDPRGRRGRDRCGCRLRELPSAQRFWVRRRRPVDPPVVASICSIHRAQDPASPCCRMSRACTQSRSVHRCDAGAGDPRGPRLAGPALSYLMPRFALSDEDMAALVEYLKKLSVRRVPGVTDTVLHFGHDRHAGRGSAEAPWHARRAGAVLRSEEPVSAQAQSAHADLRQDPGTARACTWRTGTAAARLGADRPRGQLAGTTGQASGSEPVYAVLSGLAGSNWRRYTSSASRAPSPACFRMSRCRS